MKDSYQKFAKDNIVIGATNLLKVAGNIFILLPLLTKKLGAHDYGIWSQANVTIGLALAFVGLGLPYAMTRFLPAKTDKEEIQEEFYSVFSLVFLFTLVISFLLILFSSFIARVFFEGATEIVKITGFIILVWSLDWVYLSFFRAFRQMARYSAVTIAQTFSEIGVIAYLVLNGHGLFSVVLSVLIVRAIFFLILSYLIKSEIGIKKPHFSKIKEYTSFGLPTIPGSISSWVVASSDRYIIGYFLGANWVGIYSVGYGFGHLPTILIGILCFVLLPTLSKLYDEGKINEVKTHLSYSLKYFLAFTIPFVFGATILSKQVLEIFSTREIASQGYFIVPLVAWSVLFYGFYAVMSSVLVLAKKTKIIGATWILAALANLLLNILIIPHLGILGAAITTLIAYALAMVITTYYSFKEFKFSVEWQFIIKSLIASAIMSMVIWRINPVEISSVILSIVIGIIVYGSILFLLKGFKKREFEFFIELIRRKGFIE